MILIALDCTVTLNVIPVKGKGNGIPAHSYGVSLVIRDHTVLPPAYTSEHTRLNHSQTGRYCSYGSLRKQTHDVQDQK